METNTKPLSKNPVSIALLIAWAPDLLHPLRLRRQPLRTFSGHLGKGRQALAESSKELRGFGLRHRWREPIPVLIILSPFCLSPISRKDCSNRTPCAQIKCKQRAANFVCIPICGRDPKGGRKRLAQASKHPSWTH